MDKLHLKRVYDAPDTADGQRILVDRLWPRGLSRHEAHIDDWIKDVAPSNELRHWFGHEPPKWEEFVRRYNAELQANGTAVALLRDAIGSKTTTLLFAAHDTEHNNAVALRNFLISTK